MKKLICLLIAILQILPISLYAGKRTYGDAVVSLVNVHEGDTFKQTDDNKKQYSFREKVMAVARTIQLIEFYPCFFL